MATARKSDIYAGMTPDFSEYMNKRLSPEQVKRSTTLVYDDQELQQWAMRILEEGRQYYDNLSGFRKKREDKVNLYLGDHYEKLIYNPDTGESMTLGDYIRSNGMTPVKNNQVRQVLKNLLGQFRDNDNQSTVIATSREKQRVGEMLTKSLQYACQINGTKELDVRQFEEFLISGFFGWKAAYGYHSHRNISDVLIDPVHPARVFFNTGITDIRKKELFFIGEIHDVRIEQILNVFAKNKADAQLIREWYGKDRLSPNTDYDTSFQQQDKSVIQNLDFYNTNETGNCRVYEIWKQINMEVLIVHDYLTSNSYEEDLENEEELELVNEQRIQEMLAAGIPIENIPLLEWETRFENIWHFWFLTPNGNILQFGRTPYDHEQTPYTLGIYPLVDGEIFGLVQDIEDQQNEINRILTLMNFIINASAKGLLMIPEDSIPTGWSPDDFSDQWAKSNGVIIYKPTKTGAKPEQVTANSVNVGAMEVLQMQMGLLEKISGVTDAIQGHRPTAGTPSSLYAQQSHNATLANRDYFEHFFEVRKERDFKIVKLQQQFYEEDRNIVIGGQEFDNDITHYIKEEAGDLDFHMAMGQSTQSTAYRQVADEFLFNLFQSQAIDLDVFLENTSMPFADKLRDSINRKREEMMQMEQSGGGQINPQAQQLIDQAIGLPQVVPGAINQPVRGVQ